MMTSESCSPRLEACAQPGSLALSSPDVRQTENLARGGTDHERQPQGPTRPPDPALLPSPWRGEDRLTDVLLVDHCVVVREGLGALIGQQPDLTVVAQSSSIRGAEGLGVKPQVIATEVDLPDAKGAEVVGRLRRVFPGIPVLALTMVSIPVQVQLVLSAGADGYLLKTAERLDLINGLRALAGGGQYLQPLLRVELARWTRSRGALGLYPEEVHVLQLLALGHTNLEIARLRHVSLRTTEAHRARIHRKLALRSRADLVAFARDAGFI
jgi:two-component system, NarL family, response regulator NreC